MKPVSSKVNFIELEHEVLKKWESEKTFLSSLEQRKNNPPYTFYDGPPFANGLPHYGHILTQTLKDIVPRYWTMRGYFVDRRFGWDCHGLPVEYEVEKKLGLKGREGIEAFGVGNFNEECRSTVFHYADEWQKTVTRLGRWVDWDRQYRTMDLSFMESIWWVFKKLYEKGLVYKDAKIVSYSPYIAAVVSNFEANLNYKDVQDPSVVIKLKVTGTESTYLLIWTTTPWTLIANLAATVHPDFIYVYAKDKTSGETYVVAKERLSFVFKDEDSYQIERETTGQELLGITYQPLFPYFKDQPNSFRVITAEFVTLDSGTGIVHTAPAFGEEDFKAAKAHGIDLVDPLDENCKYLPTIKEYAGVFIKDAEKSIMRDLKAQNLVYRHETFVHSYPHCDRSNGPLIYRAIPTWYVAVEKIKDQLIDNNQTINWVPGHLKEGRMGQWLKNARDWAISRNRFWGTPLPIWVSEDDDQNRIVVGSKEELESLCGQPITDLHKHFIDELTWKDKVTGSTMRRIPEVFDCWFESGSMPYAQNHYPFENAERFNQIFPADFIAEGQDQTRGWFYTLAILSSALFNKPAFKNVIVNGIVLAKDGKKMSKRLKNYTPPENLLEQLGADSVRLYLIHSPVLRAEDLKFDDEGVREITRSVLLPLWNAYSFLSNYAVAENWQPTDKLAQDGPQNIDHSLDRWILSRLQSLCKSIEKNMKEYKLYEVVPAVIGFIDELTNTYIRLNRQRFWNTNTTIAKDTLDAFNTLYFVMHNVCKILAPFAPFISEVIYQGLVDGLKSPKSVHLCDFPMPKEVWIDPKIESSVKSLSAALDLGRQIRAKEKLKTRQILSKFTLYHRDQDLLNELEIFIPLLKSEINVRDVIFEREEGASIIQTVIKPNFRALGKEFGPHIKILQQSIEALSDSEKSTLLHVLDRDGEAQIGPFKLNKAQLMIESIVPKDGGAIATDGKFTMRLDTNLNADLIEEGLSREVINRIQVARKDADLQITDRLDLEVSTDERIKRVFAIHKEVILRETLTKTLLFVDEIVQNSNPGFICETEVDGSPLKLLFRKSQ